MFAMHQNSHTAGPYERYRSTNQVLRTYNYSTHLPSHNQLQKVCWPPDAVKAVARERLVPPAPAALPTWFIDSG